MSTNRERVNKAYTLLMAVDKQADEMLEKPMARTIKGYLGMAEKMLGIARNLLPEKTESGYHGDLLRQQDTMLALIRTALHPYADDPDGLHVTRTGNHAIFKRDALDALMWMIEDKLGHDVVQAVFQAVTKERQLADLARLVKE